MSNKRLVYLAKPPRFAEAFFAVRSNRPQALPADPGPAMPRSCIATERRRLRSPSRGAARSR